MKYQHEIVIKLPRERVLKLFDNPDNMPKWQPGFVSLEPISGTPGQVGATSKLRYKFGKRDIEMVETITRRNLPDEFSGTYETKGVKNWINNRFEETPDGSTRWISENEFRFTGYMKLFGFFMPGAFKKQSYQYMTLFKKFAENTVKKTA